MGFFQFEIIINDQIKMNLCVFGLSSFESSEKAQKMHSEIK